MPRRIALEFVRSTMEWHQGSWSGMWMWEQPADDEIVVVGGIYGSPPSVCSVSEIIGQPKDPNDAVEVARRLGDRVALVDLARRLWGDDGASTSPFDYTYEPDTSDIIACETFTVPYPVMSLIDQVRYRYAMMWVNGPNYGHHWSCDFLEELGGRYYEHATEQIVWAGHDCDRDLSDFMAEVAKRGYTFPADRDRNYIASTICFEDDDLEEWVAKADERDTIFPAQIFGHQRDELITLMAYGIEQAQEAWESGDLQFGKDAPKVILEWMQNENIEPVEIKPTFYDALRNDTLGDYLADS